MSIMNDTVRILIADDHQIMREGLLKLLADEKGLCVVGQAANGREAVRMAEELAPDVIIMDVSMPDLNGIEAARQIRDRCPRIRVIALSMYSDKRFVTGMFKAGVAGYLLKDSAFTELAGAVRAVHSEGSYISPKIAGVVLEDYVNHLSQERVAVPEALTPREIEVLQLIAEGVSTKDIAARLFVSAKTVETHRRQIMTKINVKSIAELTKYAIREGLTSLDR